MSKVYAKYKDLSAKQGRAPYMPAADVSAAIRALLKAKFPKCKFSVRVSSGGGSVRIEWIDGPIEAMVSEIVQPFSGRGFDGSIDYEYYKDVYLLPDGSAVMAQSEGSQRCGGYSPEVKVFKPSPEAVRVSPSVYIFMSRGNSFEAMQRALMSYAAKYPGDDLADAIKEGAVGVSRRAAGGWEFFGLPEKYSGIGPGSQYGGDCVLRMIAARKMVA